MATYNYLSGRKRYQRPQGVLWSNNPGTLVSLDPEDPNSDKMYVPTGYEIGASVPSGTPENEIDQFLILSDHNRSDIAFNNQRIEQRVRTINGRMRSYHIADKLEISFSWTMLPSRSYNLWPEFDSSGLSPISPKYTKRDADGTTYETAEEYTADGGAGGVEILDWYNNHQGPFWMFLSYDNYRNFGTESEDFSNLYKYSEVVQVYFSNFNYSVVKRGGSIHDLWNISVTLEEV